MKAMAEGRRIDWKSPMTRNQKIKWVMRKAWQMAKAAVPLHGGRAKEYLGAAIRMAWAMLKTGFNAIPTFSTTAAVYHRDQVSAEVAASEVSFSSEAVPISFDFSDIDTVDQIEAPVATVATKKSNGFFGKIAKAARKAITAVADFLTCKVHIELVTPQME